MAAKEAALPASRNILEEGGVRVRIASQSDDADRDAEWCQPLEQALIVTWLLGVRRIGEQHDVSRAFLDSCTIRAAVTSAV